MPKCYYKDCLSTSKSKQFKNLRYHPFPKPIRNMAKCLLWIDLCANDQLNTSNITKNVYVCEKHFQDNNTDPTPYSTCTSDDIRDPASLAIQSTVEIGTAEVANDINTVDSGHKAATDHLYNKPYRMVTLPQSLFDVRSAKATLQKSENFFFYLSLSKSRYFHYFTGLELTQFEALYHFLDENVMGLLKYKRQNGTPTKNRFTRLSYRDKLCLMLIRLRRGYTLRELSAFYYYSITHISIIFYTWTQFVYLQTCCLRNDLFKSSRDTEKNEMPACFRMLDDKVTLILDTTEVRMQMSRNFQRQGNTHSSYKHYNTIKFLIGISTRGAIVYNSEGYEGSISDNALFKTSDILNFLEEGDVLMVDRGFTVQDVCDEHKFKLIIPPFLGGRTKLTAEEEILTKKIAKCRIHVERSIRRMKAYHILSKPIQITMLPIISNIVNIICFLVNFEKPLVN